MASETTNVDTEINEELRADLLGGGVEVSRGNGVTLEEFAKIVIVNSHGAIGNCFGPDFYEKIPQFDRDGLAQALEDYLRECEEKGNSTVGSVRLFLNDYIQKLGIGLASVRVTPLTASEDDAEKTELFGYRDGAHPTVGYMASGDNADEVQFPTEPYRESLTPLSKGTFAWDASMDSAMPAATDQVHHSFVAADRVGAHVSVVDGEKLSKIGLPATRSTVSHADGGVYFCRYFK